MPPSIEGAARESKTEPQRWPTPNDPLANIRERLELMYGERALVKSGRFDAEYIVTLRFPYLEDRAMLAT